MKTLKFFSLLFVSVLVLGTACKDKAATDNTRESLATTNTPNAITPQTPTNPNDPNATPAPVGPLTTIEFEEAILDFGEVTEGDKVTRVYKFKNTGSEPLVISNAKGSCGCTVPQWPREPIAVGGEGEIEVQFDTKGKGSPEGRAQSKRVTITANTDPVNTYLTIKGKVLKPEADS